MATIAGAFPAGLRREDPRVVGLGLSPSGDWCSDMMRASVARRIVGIWVLFVMSLVASSTPALASAPSPQATDPNANSPAGVMDAIPLESARQDAAPRAHNGHRLGGGVDSIGSAPGVTGVRVPLLVPGGQPGSLSHSVNGFGASPSVPGLDAPPGPGLGAVEGEADSAPLLSILLAAIVIAIGLASGIGARRASGRSSP